MARPTLCTKKTRDAIVKAIRAGNYKSTACAAVGIHRDTLNDWEHRGAAGEEPYKAFSDALKMAEAKAESDLLAKIMKARPSIPGEGGRGADLWQSWCWVMERRWPGRWGGRVRATVNDELDALTSRLRSKLDDATFSKVVDATSEEATSASSAEARH